MKPNGESGFDSARRLPLTDWIFCVEGCPSPYWLSPVAGEVMGRIAIMAWVWWAVGGFSGDDVIGTSQSGFRPMVPSLAAVMISARRCGGASRGVAGRVSVVGRADSGRGEV